MKIFRELYFRGSSHELNEFVNKIGDYETNNWKQVQNDTHLKDYLLFKYIGEEVDKARVSIYLGDRVESGEIKVGNIVPTEKSRLSVEEYNKVLIKFYNDVIKPYKEKGTNVSISEPSNDIFDPKSIISETALNKLKIFCRAANKSTGASHPCDRQRWYDFICQTVDDGKMFDYDTLADFLQDEAYWGEKVEDNNSIMGNLAWSKEKAHQLALEYSKLSSIIEYYKDTRGV